MTVEIHFLEDDFTEIPKKLLRASHGIKEFSDLHLEYWTVKGGQSGACTYAQAFESLVSDMRSFDIPVRYSSYESFRVAKFKKHTK